jgi:hypothetical protein
LGLFLNPFHFVIEFGQFDSKESLLLAVFYRRELSVRVSVCAGSRFIRRSIPQLMLTHYFFAIWFRARTRVRWIVFDVLVFCFGFSPVRVGSTITCSWILMFYL